MSERILCVPDIHFPWVDVGGMNELFSFAKDFKPDHIVQIGDALDQYTWSRFTRDIDYISPMEELAEAQDMYHSFWQFMVSLDAECVQMLGNHDVRIAKMADTKYPEIAAVLSHLGLYEKLYGHPGVTLIRNPRKVHMIRDVGFHHGDFLRTMVPGKRAQYLGYSVVFGHTHRQWVMPLPDAGGIFEMNVGTLSDDNAKPLQYTGVDKPWQVKGWGYLEDSKPHLVTL